MIDGWIILTAALTYVSFLFAVAYFGDRRMSLRSSERGRPIIYALSLAVYCTSWTFFGSVGLAAKSGFDFIPVYLGAIIMIGIGWPLLQRIVRLAKAQNITSIADFIAARYGKSQALASIVTIIAVAGTIPYIALQLKAVSASVTTMLGQSNVAFAHGMQAVPIGDIAFAIAMALAAFAVLFGTRHIDATEHQEGLMLAIATESVVKILAFLTVGIFVTFWMFDGLGDLWRQASERPEIRDLFSREFNGGTWLTITFLSLVCIILLPRQFHVAVVENNSRHEIRRAMWLFPIYLILINIFVVPIAVAGMLTFPNGVVDADMFVLALPLSAGANGVTMFAFLGGLSAATAMVIVASVALAIMVCNDLIVPFLLRRRFMAISERDEMAEMGPLLLNIRRAAIFAIVALAYLFHRTIAAPHALASIGLLSFAAIAQFAPAFFGGLVWRGATARGAIAGILVGFAIWAYTMLLPWFMGTGWVSETILQSGPFGIGLLRPQVLFNMEFDPITHGVLWSLIFNISAFVTVSMMRPPSPIERMQANVFVQNDFPVTPAPAIRLWRSSITVEDLTRTAARYVGTERAQRSFAEHAESRRIALVPHAEADLQFLRFTEHLLASAIGAASSRLVLSLLLRRQNVGHRSALKLLDDASEALQYNRDLLQSALDQVGQGISVFDKEMRLICWNRQFRILLGLPPDLGRVGIPLDQILRHVAGEGDFGQGPIERIVDDRMNRMVIKHETFQERVADGKRVLEIRTSAMPQGGIVTTYTDITQRVESADALTRINETLERRVRERTAELTQVNLALTDAKAKADEASLDKTRFLAAASHDILQPLNAARLYTTSLVERAPEDENKSLVHSIDVSLEVVEEILGALLDISRLDTGSMEPELSIFPLSEFFDRLALEFEPVARDKKLELHVVPTTVWVRSDRRMLRRVLQNLLSNAIKYTTDGTVLLGCRRRKGRVIVQVWDTGPGIPRSSHALVFKEFQRLDDSSRGVRGLGLGLSIVQRIGRVLDHPIALTSRPGRGSMFSVTIPMAEPKYVDHQAIRRVVPGHQVAGCVALCLDNEPQIVESMTVLLTSWGCEVLPALSVEEACKQIAESDGRPDIVLADYHLDDGTGIEAIETIRKLVGNDVPGVIITADHSPEVQRDVRRRGLTLLRKPLKPAALRAVIAQSRRARAAAE